MTNLIDLIERLDALDEQRTPGEWRLDSTTSEFIRPDTRHWAVAQGHTGFGCSDPSLDIGELERAANADFVTS